MKEIGKQVKCMAKEYANGLMELTTKGFGKTVSRRVQEFLNYKMVQYTLENLKKTYQMGMEKRLSKINQSTMDTFLMDNFMVMEDLNGKMEMNTKDNGKIIK